MFTVHLLPMETAKGSRPRPPFEGRPPLTPREQIVCDHPGLLDSECSSHASCTWRRCCWCYWHAG